MVILLDDCIIPGFRLSRECRRRWRHKPPSTSLGWIILLRSLHRNDQQSQADHYYEQRYYHPVTWPPPAKVSISSVDGRQYRRNTEGGRCADAEGAPCVCRVGMLVIRPSHALELSVRRIALLHERSDHLSNRVSVFCDSLVGGVSWRVGTRHRQSPYSLVPAGVD
jgi:hypothetical protein